MDFVDSSDFDNDKLKNQWPLMTSDRSGIPEIKFSGFGSAVEKWIFKAS